MEPGYARFDQKNSFAAVKRSADKVFAYVGGAVGKNGIIPLKCSLRGDVFRCLRFMSYTSYMMLSAPSWIYVEEINNNLQNIISVRKNYMARNTLPNGLCRHCRTEHWTKADMQVEILLALKGSLDILESYYRIGELYDQYPSYETLVSLIASIIAAYKRNEHHLGHADQISEGFKAIYNNIWIHVQCYERFQWRRFVKAPNKECSVCLHQNLNRRKDFAILSNCRHLFCVTCAKAWFSSQ